MTRRCACRAFLAAGCTTGEPLSVMEGDQFVLRIEASDPQRTSQAPCK